MAEASTRRVAVVGSGPAGVYAANALADHVCVDVLDRLPCPFGLVRYGVAPDHPKIKSISATLQKMLDHPAVRFLGNIEVGTDVTLAELHRHYDAVLYASGAAVDRRMGVAGEDLPGSVSATEFVNWYSAHPDARPGGYPLDATSVVVVGAGNVALDVVRFLAKSADELAATDLPDPVVAALRESAVEEIHLVARRGPAQAKWTTKELRELGELDNAEVVVDPADLELDPVSQQTVDSTAQVRRNVEVLRGWAGRRTTGKPRRVVMHFCLQPAQVLGSQRVTGMRFEVTGLDEDGRAAGTGQTRDLPAQLVVRSVGYRGLPPDDLPFDPESGTIPQADGRVLRDGAPVAGEYVAGWIKRGPTGVIGTNKRDANQTVASLLADLSGLPPAPEPDPDAVTRLVIERGVQVVTWKGWNLIETAEAARGEAQGREKVKIANREELLRAAAGRDG